MTVQLGDWNIGRGLKAVLIGQCIIALLLVLADLSGRMTFPGTERDQIPQGPVEPGDQVRRYQTETPRPTFMSPSRLPNVTLPNKIPERLEFAVLETDEFGDVLLLNGAIDVGDAQRLEGFVASLEEIPDTIILNSPGGVVDEALTIGREIRRRGIQTAVPSGMFCASSCPYLLAGGTERTVSRGAVVGLHQHYYDARRYLPVYFAVENIQRGQGRTMQFLLDMGLGAELMLFSLNTSPNDIYVLVEQELVDTKLATRMVD